MPKLTAYQFMGMIAPGTIVVLAVLALFPDIAPIMSADISIGDFGLIVILALVAGQLVQALGNVFEAVFWWPQGGMPTTWPAKEKTSLLSSAQLGRLREAVRQDFGIELSEFARGRGPTRELYVAVRAGGRSDRIEVFNENYGLLRGITSGLLITMLIIVIKNPVNLQAAGLLLLGAGVAAMRMKRFGEHYARELFAEYLQSRSASARAVAR